MENKEIKKIEIDKCSLFYNVLEANTKIETLKKSLREKYIVPPFTVLDSKQGEWIKRRNEWKSLGIKSEIGRNSGLFNARNKSFANDKYGKKEMSSESIFDPVLCEILYHWYCPYGGNILDPFAGGSVRGIVANYLGYNYVGIDIRQEQIDSNNEQADNIIPENKPFWICGDSNIELDGIFLNNFDLIFSCPPYFNIEVYSDLEGDISNMDYEKFKEIYRSIIKKSCNLLSIGGYSIFIVGEVRNKKTGELYNFVGDTINAFKDAGLVYYNEAILLNSIGTAMLRIGTSFERGNGKLVSTHQNILIFKKIN